MTQFGFLAASISSCERNRGNYFCLAGVLLMVSFSSPVLAARSHDCPEGEGNKTVRNLRGVQVEFTATKNDDYAFGHACQVVVRDSAQNVVFSEEDFDLSLVMADAELNGDRVPDLVLESYSGGAHCCWTYYIISQDEKPHLIAQFDNERGAGFVRTGKDGRSSLPWPLTL